jgi:hypothetical protein
MPRLTSTINKDNPICPVCEFRPHTERSIYCEECGSLLLHKPEQSARVVAMVNARLLLGNFRCYYTGDKMNLKDPTDPKYAHFDHRTPGRKGDRRSPDLPQGFLRADSTGAKRAEGDLVMCCAWVNQVKGRLDEDEFWAVVFAYVDHLDGKPFPPELVRFKYWKSTAEGPVLTLAMIPRPLRTNAEFCDICGEKPLPRAKYCKRCSWIVYHAGENLARVAGLKRAVRKERKLFLCRYTGLVLELVDIGSPRYVNFDHVVPGVKGRLEAVCAFINRMKTAMTKREFDRVMRELARFKREGGEFDGKVVRFRYWRKVNAEKMQAVGN